MCHCQRSLHCSGRIHSHWSRYERKEKQIPINAAHAWLHVPVMNTLLPHTAGPQSSSGRSSTGVLKAQGLLKPLSRPDATTFTKLNRSIVACYCHYLLGWRGGVSCGVMVMPNTTFPRNCEADLPMLYSALAALRDNHLILQQFRKKCLDTFGLSKYKKGFKASIIKHSFLLTMQFSATRCQSLGI